MKKIHEKSHSCIRSSRVHGVRRRRCTNCGKTWTVWKRKRGRKHSRPDKKLLKKIFVERQRLNQTAPVRLKQVSISGMSRRLARVMKAGLELRAPRFSGTQHVLLIDALWFRFRSQRCTLYLRALKRVGGHTARFLPPILLQGRESAAGWRTVIDEIPDRLKHRIVAMVSDGWRGVERAAQKNHWILQRCHFHFIAQLQVNRGKRKKMRDQAIREDIYQTARILLTTKTNVRHCKNHLRRLIQRSDCPRRLRLIIREFLRRLSDFRAYLNHPDITLPITTNAMESKNKQIRQLCRPLRTPDSLLKWVSHFLKLNPEITCNGGKIPQN